VREVKHVLYSNGRIFLFSLVGGTSITGITFLQGLKMAILYVGLRSCDYYNKWCLRTGSSYTVHSTQDNLSYK